MTRSVEFNGPIVGVSFSSSKADAPQAIASAVATVLADVDRPPLAGYYPVETIGKSAEEIAGTINALGDYHAAKSARIYAAEPLLNTTLDVDGEIFTWSCITITERGTDCEMYVNVVDADGKPPKGAPLLIVRARIEDLPSNDDLVALMTNAIRTVRASQTAQANKMTQLQQLLGG